MLLSQRAIMVFENIKETVSAFQGQQGGNHLSEIERGPVDRPRLAVILAIGAPIAFIVGYAFNWLLIVALGPTALHLHGILGRYFDIIVSITLSFIMTRANWELVRRIPIHKLNPYFGRKLDETIGAFLTRGQH